MAGSIQETVPGVLTTLWNLENELRSAAQNGVILRGEDARNHLHQARFHLDQLLGLAKGSPVEAHPENSENSASNSNKSQGE